MMFGGLWGLLAGDCGPGDCGGLWGIVGDYGGLLGIVGDCWALWVLYYTSCMICFFSRLDVLDCPTWDYSPAISQVS